MKVRHFVDKFHSMCVCRRNPFAGLTYLYYNLHQRKNELC